MTSKQDPEYRIYIMRFALYALGIMDQIIRNLTLMQACATLCMRAPFLIMIIINHRFSIYSTSEY